MVAVVGGGLLLFRNAVADEDTRPQKAKAQASELLDPTATDTTTTALPAGAEPTAPPGRTIASVGPWYVTVPDGAEARVRRLHTASNDTVPVGQWTVDHGGWVEVVRIYDVTNTFADAADLVQAWAIDPDPADGPGLVLTEREDGPTAPAGAPKPTTWWTVGGSGTLPGTDGSGGAGSLEGTAVFVALDENFLLSAMVVGLPDQPWKGADLSTIVDSIGTR